MGTQFSLLEQTFHMDSQDCVKTVGHLTFICCPILHDEKEELLSF